MGRPRRVTAADLVYHALNRANGRIRIFEKAADYDAFERAMAEARERFDMRILAYCLMPNHWHLVLWPPKDEDLSHFVGWLTLTFTQRWHAHRKSAGSGHLFQGRFKSFPVQTDEHLLTVLRYVEGNPVRAGLVKRAQEWRWSSGWRREHTQERDDALLAKWPLASLRDWAKWVNQAQTDKELESLRLSINRGRPYGSEVWMKRTAIALGLETTLRPRGRPRKRDTKGS
jgi:putative transposase